MSEILNAIYYELQKVINYINNVWWSLFIFPLTLEVICDTYENIL